MTKNVQKIDLLSDCPCGVESDKVNAHLVSKSELEEIKEKYCSNFCGVYKDRNMDSYIVLKRYSPLAYFACYVSPSELKSFARGVDVLLDRLDKFSRLSSNGKVGFGWCDMDVSLRDAEEEIEESIKKEYFYI